MIRLEQLEGPLRFTLSPGRPLVLGRSNGCDLVVPDPAVSRRHATLEADSDGLLIRDLGSANGTHLNGLAVQEARAAPPDVVTFGATAFRITALAEDSLGEEIPPHTAVRSLVDLLPTLGHDRRARVLDRLLEVAAGLAGDLVLERLLETVAELTLEQVDADRVALLLVNPATGALEPAAIRSNAGEGRLVVPRAIAERAVRDRAPVVTESAAEEPRLASGSVRMQRVRSAICVPLLTADPSAVSPEPPALVLGALYADTITRPTPFSDDEAASLMAFAGLAAVALARARFAEDARRERDLRRSFERFFAPAVAETITAGEAARLLAGSRRDAAVLFTDIRGFTPLAERLAPEEIARLLGEYFGVLVDVIFEHGGTLDKFIGDAVMAVWGAPVSLEGVVDRAVAAALAIRTELASLNARRRGQGRPEITAGIGISYGAVFAGNVGSERRLEYTVVGDPVNVAAHLCSAARPGEILLTQEAADRLHARALVEAGEPVVLKGGRSVAVCRVTSRGKVR